MGTAPGRGGERPDATVRPVGVDGLGSWPRLWLPILAFVVTGLAVCFGVRFHGSVIEVRVVMWHRLGQK